MLAPLSDLVILEASGDVATRYCGKLFAEHGARVIQAYAPDDSRLAYGGASAAAYAAWLDHGKQRGAVPPGIAVDLVIAGQTPADITRAEALTQRLSGNPTLLALTWFGLAGPCANWQGSDAIIQAMGGIAYAFGTVERPVLPQGHAPQVVGGVIGFIAAMAALLGRRRGAATARIGVSIHESYICLAEHSGPGRFAGGPATARRGVNRYGPVYPQTIFPSVDGWIGISALTPQQWHGFCELIGLPELAKDKRYETTDLRMAAADELDEILMPAVARLAAGPMLEDGQRKYRIPLGPVPTMAQVLDTPHWRERQSFRKYNGNGPGFEGPAMPFRLHGRGEGAVATEAGGKAGPLAGIRVLDLSMGWSGPLAGRHFADLGAEVIKVEGCAHIDWWRGWNALEAGDPPPYETKSNFNAVNRNKRGITLDLRAPRGVELLKRFAEDADLLIENYAPGVLDKLGLGAKALAAVNPRLSYISMGAFGSAGPWSGFRAYGSTTEQASGMPWLHGEAEWAPAMQHTAYGDPIAGIYAAAASLAALFGRHATGGTTIDLSQVECLFQLCADGIIAQSATGTAPPRTGSRRATSAWTGVLRCIGDDSWLAIDAADEAALHRATAGNPESWAATRTAPEAAAALQAAGIAAGPVMPGTALLHDPHLVASGFWLEADRRHVGRHVVPRAPYALDGARPAFVRPAPTLGEHNAEVLREILHLPAAEIAALEAAGLIGSKAI